MLERCTENVWREFYKFYLKVVSIRAVPTCCRIERTHYFIYTPGLTNMLLTVVGIRNDTVPWSKVFLRGLRKNSLIHLLDDFPEAAPYNNLYSSVEQ